MKTGKGTKAASHAKNATKSDKDMPRFTNKTTKNKPKQQQPTPKIVKNHKFTNEKGKQTILINDQ
jgi:hypothetical protein